MKDKVILVDYTIDSSLAAHLAEMQRHNYVQVYLVVFLLKKSIVKQKVLYIFHNGLKSLRKATILTTLSLLL